MKKIIHVDDMLLMWGMVTRYRKIGGPDCKPSSADLKSIWNQSPGGSPPDDRSIPDVLLTTAEIDGWINKQPHIIGELFHQEYVLGTKESERMQTTTAGGVEIMAPVLDADGDQVHDIIKTFSFHSFDIGIDHIKMTSDKLGISQGVLLRWASGLYKKRLAQEKGWAHGKK